MKNKKKWASLFVAAMLAMIAVACAEETPQQRTEEGLPATIRLNVVPDVAKQAQTRADENAIKDLHVLVYNASGELIGWNYGTSSTLIVNTRSSSGCTLYAIANTGNSTLFSGGVASTEAKLKALKTPAIGAWDGLTTASHLVMVGSKTGVTISAGGSALEGNIIVTRIAAKVTLNIGVKEGSGITIKDYQVCSLPKQSYYVPTTTDGVTDWISGASTEVNATSVNTSFFMYENRKGTVSSITAQKDKGESKASANSTYVVINGEHNFYKATWRVYLGENNTSDFNIKRNSQYEYNITLNRPGTNGIDTRVTVEKTFLSVVGVNSNCYMVKPGNAVTVPVERANESTVQLTGSTLFEGTYHQLQASATWTASLVWESSKGLVTLSENTGTGPTGGFKVTAKSTSEQGNAVVAIKNASNEILWSWHIWVTTYDGSTRFTHNNGERDFLFMDRALGASTSTAGELTSCGLMYQWGRKDPFPGIGQPGGDWTSIANDTDPIQVYNALGTLSEIKKTAVPPGVTPNNMTNATRNPDTFYYNVTAPLDWFVYDNSLSQNNDLWSGGDIALNTAVAKSVFDPCPAGWRIPPWLNSVSPFAGMESGSNWNNHGHNWTGTGGYFPASGYRQSKNGTLYGASTSGYSWSGSPIDVKGYYLALDPTGAFQYSNNRAHGFPVRCCLDNI